MVRAWLELPGVGQPVRFAALEQTTGRVLAYHAEAGLAFTWDVRLAAFRGKGCQRRERSGHVVR